jgi:outer membrane scaffolding protein for murein synthesis (MipA/OmpV family)
MTTRWTLGGFASISTLGSQAKDSPLIIERGSDSQSLAGVFFTYQF